MSDNLNDLRQASDDEETAEPEPIRNIARDLIIAYKIPIILAIAGIGGYFVLASGAVFRVPDWILRVVRWSVAGFIIAFLPIRIIIKQLIDRDRNILMALDLSENNSEPELWNLGDKTRREMEVEDGELFQEGQMEIAIDYDPVKNVATGVYLEELTPTELLRFRSSLSNAYDIMQEEMLEGAAAREAARTGLYLVSKEQIQMVVRQLVGESVFEGEELNSILDDAIERAAIDSIDEELDERAQENNSVDVNEDMSTLQKAREIESDVVTDGGEPDAEAIGESEEQ